MGYDDQPHADHWRPDRSRGAQEWLVEGLRREDHYAPYRLVRIHGTAYVPRLRPADTPAGERGCCFANAFRLASVDGTLRYVEGYATLWGSDTGLQRHAWCADDAGRVVDPTWCAKLPLPLAYRGIEMPLEIVEPYCYDRSRGTLDAHWSDIDQLAARLGLPWPV